MSSYFGDSFAVSTTPSRIVEAADMDRRVHYRNLGAVSIRLGFEDVAAGFVAVVSGPADDFVLPADEELWSSSESSTGVISLLVTIK